MLRRPTLSGWVQMYSAFVWVVLSMAPGSFFAQLFKYAMSSMKTKDPDDTDVVADAAEAFQMDISWHEVTGKGRKQCEATLFDGTWGVRIMLLAVLLEGTDCMARMYMLASDEDFIAEKPKWAEILNLLNPSHSVLRHLLQYLACLVSTPEACPRLRLLWVFRGCSSFQQWYHEHRLDIEVLHRAASGLKAAVQTRQMDYLYENFSVLSVTDTRLSQAARFSHALHITSSRQCCLQPGINRYAKSWSGDDPHRIMQNSRTRLLDAQWAFPFVPCLTTASHVWNRKQLLTGVIQEART